jgi:hypothetical protein
VQVKEETLADLLVINNNNNNNNVLQIKLNVFSRSYYVISLKDKAWPWFMYRYPVTWCCNNNNNS